VIKAERSITGLQGVCLTQSLFSYSYEKVSLITIGFHGSHKRDYDSMVATVIRLKVKFAGNIGSDDGREVATTRIRDWRWIGSSKIEIDFQRGLTG
jgi:hypothetical protein